MKNIKVDLLHFTPSSVIVEAVGLPHKLKNPTIEIATKVIADLNHTSVSEHCVMNFKISGISRLCMQELSRHRISSTTASSSRYTLLQVLKEFGNVQTTSLDEQFVTPNKPDDIDEDDWKEFEDELKKSNYNSLQMQNYFKDKGFKPDVLKYLLTENFRISLVWTINLRSLLNFFKLRLDKSAHFEIRQLAKLIKSQVNRVPYIKNIIDKIDNQMSMEKILEEIKRLRTIHIHNNISDNLLLCLEKFIKSRS